MRFVSIAVSLLITAAPAVAQDFSSQGLAGFARIPASARDSLGETLGGFGSGMALVPGSWHGGDGVFTGTLAMLPDRGWNTEGTTDYRARLQYFDVTVRPANGTDTIQMRYSHSLLLTDAAGAPTTGLDASGMRPAAKGFPDLPLGANNRVAMDSEAVAMPDRSGFWVSDEYGPYVYRFDMRGRMVAALKPPAAFIPMRGGHESFSANSPPLGAAYDVGSPQTGRQNNQGFEGMSITPDGKLLFVVNQSALVQDLDAGAVKTSRRHVRILAYDITAPTPRLVHEYVVALPLYSIGNTSGLVAAQSEMLALNNHQLLLLCRDSGGGQSLKRDGSVYRSILTVELDGASDIAGQYDGTGDSVSPLGCAAAADHAGPHQPAAGHER